jgi:hypothetical protein
MKSANTTKTELLDELKALREQVSELERHERNYRQARGIFLRENGPILKSDCTHA